MVVLLMRQVTSLFRHLIQHNKCAVKIVGPLDKDDYRNDAVSREAELPIQLKHANVVLLRDSWIEEVSFLVKFPLRIAFKY